MFKKILFLFLSLVLIFSFNITKIKAQTTTNDNINNKSEFEFMEMSLENIEVETPNKVPAQLGMLWQNLKENVSLFFTFDPVKKTEKRLRYAERKLQLVKKLTEEKKLTDYDRERIEKIVSRANKLFKKVIDNQTKWEKKLNQEKLQNILVNIARHQFNQEMVLSHLETRLGPEKVLPLRNKSVNIQNRVLNILKDKEKVLQKEELKKQVQIIREFLNQNRDNLETYKRELKKLNSRVKVGDNQAKKLIQDLNQLRSKTVKDELRQQTRQIKSKLQSVDKNLFRTLKTNSNVNVKVKNNLKNNGDNEEIRAKVRTKIQEIRQENQKLRNEIKEETKEDRQEVRQIKQELKQKVKTQVQEQIEDRVNLKQQDREKEKEEVEEILEQQAKIPEIKIKRD